MLQAHHSEARSLGQILSQARIRRGLTQEELGKDAGIGQAAVAKIERNQIIPKVTTLSRYLRALGLTPEEDLEVWHLIRGHVEEIDWAGRLGLDLYLTARHKAVDKLAKGDIYDAYGYIEAMSQLAETRQQKAYSQLLHANRFKDLGFVHLAERYYNLATATLGRDGDNLLMNKVMVNLADLHAESGHTVLADACLDYVLRQNPVASTRAYAMLVRGKVMAASGSAEAREKALQALEEARHIYDTEVKDEMKSNGQAWVRLLTAEIRSFDDRERVAREALQEIKQIRETSGPAQTPRNPELHVRASLVLAERTGDGQALSQAQRAAQRLGFQGLVARVRPLGSPVVKWLMMLMLTVGTFGGQAQAAPHPSDYGSTSIAEGPTVWLDSWLMSFKVSLDAAHGAGLEWIYTQVPTLLTTQGEPPPDGGTGFSENSPDPDNRF